ncbi:hypothetical protein BDN72DRAFT_855779 [Pluteus cervinus]|uniref:Uncharacterized protein n=1 Tax=Pluteus cervinus TaxID=181527 RepID=A0ACD3B2K3_9AGAR|nr:hypothetical protein BDN72DRAFT_855779 [Pluteus cervinus]
MTGLRCDENGTFLQQPTPPPPFPPPPQNNRWHPFEDRAAFDFAFQEYVDDQSSITSINRRLETWSASLFASGRVAPWSNAQEMYETIDSIQHGPAPWKVYHFRYQGELPPNPPKWMMETYELCVRDSRQLLHFQLATPTFRDDIHYTPYQQFDQDGGRVWSNLMSGDWAWEQADLIAETPSTFGSTFIPIVIGSDKTTVSVATGHQQYHPVYMSLGNLSNTARRAQTHALLPVAFLPIPKTNRKQRKRRIWQKFCRQLYHACLELTFLPLLPGMTTPEVVHCPDGHFRKAIYGIGPYIADYPEQVWLAGIVQSWCPKCLARPTYLDNPLARPRTQAKTEFLITCFDPGTLWSDWGIRADVTPFTNAFPRADIHELLSPDLLHQVIKGAFQDHLVTWTCEYLTQEYPNARAMEIITDIDRRISAVPPFPGLRRFPDGRDFQQWTGDDSKALMKVYLGCVAGYLPSNMVQCLAALLDFTYLARRNALNNVHLQQMDDALDRYTHFRESYILAGFQTSIPRQHALQHYITSIRLFGSPNGLCSSITESKHIKAVKEPWRRSNRYKALIQMLRTIDRIDKLGAACADYTHRGMMRGTTLTYTIAVSVGVILPEYPIIHVAGDGDEWEDDIGPVSGPKDESDIVLSASYESTYPHFLDDLATHIHQARFPEAARRFLWSQLNPDSPIHPAQVPIQDLPYIVSRVFVHHSAVARFYAPSDLCGAGGMKQERIRSNPSWRGGDARWDTVFVETDSAQSGMRGFTIGRILLFFSFKYQGINYPCALVHWLVCHGDEPDPETGMWVVYPEYEGNGLRTLEVVHLGTIARAAHLIPAFGGETLPEDFEYTWSLDAFESYYVNPYADHHVHELIHR